MVLGFYRIVLSHPFKYFFFKVKENTALKGQVVDLCAQTCSRAQACLQVSCQRLS